MSVLSEETKTHLVVGAGPAGLAAARAFLARGLRVEVLEAHDDVGGIWDQSNPGSPMYDSAHFISSSGASGFPGFPMPEDYPDYPAHPLILDYLRAFADAYDLRRVIRFGVRVERAIALDDGTGWSVTTSDGRERHYATLTAATGTTWAPTIPGWSGTFAGELRHSSEHRSAERFRDRRVLVVGAGNSGVDIACDAATAASRAAISVRRGYHLIPKHLFGMPADVFASSGPHLPAPVTQRMFALVLRLTVGDLTRYGWPKPDHAVLESHPIINDQIVHHLRHGDITVRPDVRGFEGHDVLFADGTREPFDVVVAATGYRYDLPYLDADLFSWDGGRPRLHLQTFSPTQPRFAALGLSELDGAAYPVFDALADLVAHAWHALEHDPATFARLRAIAQAPAPDLSGGVRHVASDRHAAYINREQLFKYLGRLRRDLHWVEGPRLAPSSAHATDGELALA